MLKHTKDKDAWLLEKFLFFNVGTCCNIPSVNFLLKDSPFLYFFEFFSMAPEQHRSIASALLTVVFTVGTRWINWPFVTEHLGADTRCIHTAEPVGWEGVDEPDCARLFFFFFGRPFVS